MITTRNQVRQTFTRHWCQSYQTGKNAWLIKGDFDHFRLTNDLYGSLISDYLLDWTLEVVEGQIASQQKRWGGEDWLCNFIGDDVTIYIPPSALREADIEQLLWKTRDAISESFQRQYMVGAAPLPADFFDDIPSDRLEGLRNELEHMDVVFDFARRQRGYLILLPVGSTGALSQAFVRVLRVLHRWSGKAVPPVDLRLDWICDPEGRSCRAFNGGFIEPPSVSFAACSIPMGVDAQPVPHDCGSVYERASLACQSGLKVCKQQHKGVFIHRCDPMALEIPPTPQPAWDPAFDSPLHWSSERRLRENLYFQPLDRPVMFQFNPVYRPASWIPASAKMGDRQMMEHYRGNAYGVGLKGINEIFGQYTADHLIGQLISTFSRVMQFALVAKGLPSEAVYIAQFVDRFTVCCKQPIFHRLEIIDLICSLGSLFNSVSADIKISQLRACIVVGERRSVGYRLFHQLAMTSLSPQVVALENSDPPIEVRENASALALYEGSLTLERSAFSSAKLLAS